MKIDIQRSEPISKYRAELEKAAQLAFRDASALIPIEGVTVFIRHDPPSVIPELGVGGFAPNGQEVYITVDANRPKFKETVIPQLYRTLLHEFHHVARWRGPGYGETLLEALVTEGLADHFELELAGPPVQPWDEALSEEEADKLIGRAKEEFDKKYSHKDWFFGSEKRNIPRWTGYTLGYMLVGHFLRDNPGKKPSTLYSSKASDFQDVMIKNLKA